MEKNIHRNATFLLFPTFFVNLSKMPQVDELFQHFFLTTIWLPHGKLWAIIQGTASLTVDQCILLILT